MNRTGMRILLDAGSVSDWRNNAEVPTDRWMSETERARLTAIAAESRRSQFVAGRWMARVLLCRWLPGTEPGDWSICGSANEPPKVRLGNAGSSQDGPPHLSISHSGDRVACAVGDHAVGVDIEALPPRRLRDLDGLMQGIGSPAEIVEWNGTALGERVSWFHRLWVIKEAWLKARGEGVTPGRLRQLSVRSALPTDEWVSWCRMSANDVLSCHAAAVALKSLVPPPDRRTAGEGWWAVDDLAADGGTDT
jgi:4'-phosphopantetheinyl transferase